MLDSVAPRWICRSRCEAARLSAAIVVVFTSATNISADQPKDGRSGQIPRYCRYFKKRSETGLVWELVDGDSNGRVDDGPSVR